MEPYLNLNCLNSQTNDFFPLHDIALDSMYDDEVSFLDLPIEGEGNSIK